MKVLFLSFYFQPDLSAGSFRNTALVSALKEKLPPGSQIHVISTLPSRYASFSVDAPEHEMNDGLVVNRIALPEHKSGMLDQSRAFITYARNVIRLTRGRDYDLVYASSSRLMTALLGAFISWRKGFPLYLDIRDIFVDTIADVLPEPVSFLFKPFFSFAERLTVSQAKRINLVSEGFRYYFESRYSDLSLSFFTNGIDDEFLKCQPSEPLASKSQLPVVVYAGNFGEGQGLHSIIPDLAKRFEGRLLFRLVGDGGRKNQLISRLSEMSLSNVEVMSPVSRSRLIEIYKDADVLFLHLNDYDAFLKVLPSKLFEYAALGKPIWAGVSGYSAEFIGNNVSNAAVFRPCDVEGAVRSFDSLELITKPRIDFVRKFSRSSIMREMADDVISTTVADTHHGR